MLRTSPVGAYTAAGNQGPVGAEDPSGNVYNWTSSLYRPYPYQIQTHEDLESAEERVLRGGAWNFNHGYLRSAYRFRNVPDFFFINIGFRVMFPG